MVYILNLFILFFIKNKIKTKTNGDHKIERKNNAPCVKSLAISLDSIGISFL